MRKYILTLTFWWQKIPGNMLQSVKTICCFDFGLNCRNLCNSVGEKNISQKDPARKETINETQSRRKLCMNDKLNLNILENYQRKGRMVSTPYTSLVFDLLLTSLNGWQVIVSKRHIYVSPWPMSGRDMIKTMTYLIDHSHHQLLFLSSIGHTYYFMTLLTCFGHSYSCIPYIAFLVSLSYNMQQIL